MNAATTLDLLYLALAISILWVGGFLTWTLYELGKLLHQVNATVSDARSKVKKLEETLMTIKEKFESLSGYAGMAAKAGKTLASYMGAGNESSKRKGKRRFEEE